MDISTVAVADDDQFVREGFSNFVEDNSWTSKELESIPDSQKKAIKKINEEADAFLCDFHLKKHAYSKFNGDQLVAWAYRAFIPAVLCTSVSDYSAEIGYDLRREIPIILGVDEVSADSIAKGFELCANEWSDKFSTQRRPWRALIRIEEVDVETSCAYAIIPAWHTKIKHRIYFDEVKRNTTANIEAGTRFHAQVNLGSESSKHLFITHWEIDDSRKK